MKKCTIIKHHSKECCKIAFAKRTIFKNLINKKGTSREVPSEHSASAKCMYTTRQTYSLFEQFRKYNEPRRYLSASFANRYTYSRFLNPPHS